MIVSLRCQFRYIIVTIITFLSLNVLVKSNNNNNDIICNNHQPKINIQYKKRSVAIISDITGHVDKFTSIGFKIRNGKYLGLDKSTVYIFEKSISSSGKNNNYHRHHRHKPHQQQYNEHPNPIKNTHAKDNYEKNQMYSLQLSCSSLSLKLIAKPLDHFGDGGGGEVPFLRLMSNIMKNEDCPKTSTTDNGNDVFAFILPQFLNDVSPALTLNDIDNMLETSSCSIAYQYFANINETICTVPNQTMSRETLNFCKDYDNQLKEEEKNHLVENTTSIQTELSHAAAVAVHERTYISEEEDSGHYLAEWTNDEQQSSFHNLNNLVDDRSFLQFKMEQHKKNRRRNLLEHIDENGVDKEELEAKKEYEKNQLKLDQQKLREKNNTNKMKTPEQEEQEELEKENLHLKEDYTKYFGKYDENITLRDVAGEYFEYLGPSLDKRAFPLLYKEKHPNEKDGDSPLKPKVTIHDGTSGTTIEMSTPKANVKDTDGQADELTDDEQQDSVFLLEGPIWASLSIEEKQKVQEGARMRHSIISFVESSTRATSHMNAGLYTKDVIEEIITRISTMLPEHIVELINGFFREPFTRMFGQFMQNNAAADLVPSSGAGFMGIPLAAVTNIQRITGLIEEKNDITPAGVVAAAATVIIPLLFNAGGAGPGGNQAPAGNLFNAGRVVQELHSQIVETVRAGVESQVDATLFSGFAEGIVDRTSQEKYSIHRHLHRAMAPQMTTFATEEIVPAVTGPVVRAMTAETTRHMTAALLPALTHALAPTLVHSLKHEPRSDYYCHYCDSAAIYCDMCHSARIADHEQDYYASYYSSYYSAYYTPYYANTIADYFSRHIIAKHKEFDGNGVTSEPPPPGEPPREEPPSEKPPTTECKVYLAKHQGGKFYDCNDNGRARDAGNDQGCIDQVLGKPDPFGDGRKVKVVKNWGADGHCQ